MPPQQLGRPTWRDLVAGRATKRRFDVAGWGRRLAGSGCDGGRGDRRAGARRRLADDATQSGDHCRRVTVGLARRDTCRGRVGRDSDAQPATRGATPLPLATVFGAPLSQPALMVGALSDYRLLDLANGTMSQPLGARYNPSSQLWPLANGQYLCACMQSATETGSSGGLVDRIDLWVRTIAANGANRLRSSPGRRSRRPGTAQKLPSAPVGVSMWASLSGDGHWLYVGWSILNDPTWTSGVDVIDVTAQHQVQAVPLADVADNGPSGPITVWAPHVAVAPDGRHVMIVGTTVVETTGVATLTRHLADIGADGTTADLRAWPSAGAGIDDPATCFALTDGFASADTWFTVCANSTPTLHRYALDGTALPTTDLSPLPGGLLVRPVVDQTRGRLYAWDPFTRLLVAVDLATGLLIGSVTASAPTAATPSGLARPGRPSRRQLARSRPRRRRSICRRASCSRPTASACMPWA